MHLLRVPDTTHWHNRLHGATHVEAADIAKTHSYDKNREIEMQIEPMHDVNATANPWKPGTIEAAHTVTKVGNFGNNFHNLQMHFMHARQRHIAPNNLPFRGMPDGTDENTFRFLLTPDPRMQQSAASGRPMTLLANANTRPQATARRTERTSWALCVHRHARTAGILVRQPRIA